MSTYPRPTNPPSARGLNTYIQGSSESDPRYANYVAPATSTTNQVNAYGAPLFKSNIYGTTGRVVNTNPSTGEFTQPKTQAPSGGGGGNSRISQLTAPGYDLNPKEREELATLLGGQQQGPSQAEIDAQNQLNQGYNEYYAMLDERMGSLGGQRTGQEQIAQNTYQQGLNTASGQLSQGEQSLDFNKQNTLRDLSDNLMRSWQQGNIYLGTRGASDSSAANQYSYALAKEGSRARGDVQGQYDQNMFKLKNIHNTETKNLELSKSNQLQQISQWFAEAQNSIRDLKGQGALQKSQQALSIAMQMAQQAKQEIASKMSMLDQWAANHATSWQQLAGQLGVAGNFNMQAPQLFPQAQAQTQQAPVSSGYGYNSKEEDPYKYGGGASGGSGVSGSWA